MSNDYEACIRELQRELDTLTTYEPPTEAWKTISRAINPKKSNRAKWPALAAAISIMCLTPYFMNSFREQHQISTNGQLPASTVTYKSMPTIEIEIKIIEIEELLTTTEKKEDRVALTKIKTELINTLSVEKQKIERFI